MKKYRSSNRKRIHLIITEFLIGFASTIGSGFLAVLNPSAGNVISGSTALSTSIAILITNEYMSKSKIISTKLRDSINHFTPRYAKTLKQSMVDKRN